MADLKEFYNWLNKEGGTTKAFSDWTAQLNESPKKRREMYDFYAEEGLTAKTWDEFDKWATDEGKKLKATASTNKGAVAKAVEDKPAVIAKNANGTIAYQGDKVPDSVGAKVAYDAISGATLEGKTKEENKAKAARTIRQEGSPYAPEFNPYAEKKKETPMWSYENRDKAQAQYEADKVEAKKQEKNEIEKGAVSFDEYTKMGWQEHARHEQLKRVRDYDRDSDVTQFVNNKLKGQIESDFAEMKKQSNEAYSKEFGKYYNPYSAESDMVAVSAGEIAKANVEDPVAFVDNTMKKAMSSKDYADLVMKQINIPSDEESDGKGRQLTMEEQMAIKDFYSEEASKVAQSLQQKVYDEYVRLGAPKNVIEYVVGDAYRNSLMGMLEEALLASATKNGSLRRELLDRAAAQYGQSLDNEYGSAGGSAIRGVKGGLTMVMDAPAFTIGGGISSSAASKGVGLVGKAMAKNAVGKLSTEVASRYLLTNSAIARTAMNVVSSMGTFTGYDTAKEGIRQVEQQKFDAQRLLDAAAGGAKSGAMLGAFGAVSGELTRNLVGTAAWIGKIGGFAGEVGFFTGMQGIEQALAEGKDLTDIDWGALTIENAAMISVMKLQHPGEMFATKNREAAKYRLDFTEGDVEALKERGYDFSNPAKALERLKEMGQTYGTDGKAADKGLQAEYLRALTDKELPINVKRKLMYLMEGKVVKPEAVLGYDIAKNDDDYTTITTRTATGLPIEVINVTNDKVDGVVENINRETQFNMASAYARLMSASEGYYRQAVSEIIKEARQRGEYIDEDYLNAIVDDHVSGKGVWRDEEVRMLDNIQKRAATLGETKGRNLFEWQNSQIKEETGIDVLGLMRSGKPGEEWSKEEMDALTMLNKRCDDIFNRKRNMDADIKSAEEKGEQLALSVINPNEEQQGAELDFDAVRAQEQTLQESRSKIGEEIARQIDELVENEGSADDFLAIAQQEGVDFESAYDYFMNKSIDYSMNGKVEAVAEDAKQNEQNSLEQFTYTSIDFESGDDVVMIQPARLNGVDGYVTGIDVGEETYYTFTDSANGQPTLVKEGAEGFEYAPAVPFDLYLEQYKASQAQEAQAKLDNAKAHNSKTNIDLNVGDVIDIEGGKVRIAAVTPDGRLAIEPDEYVLDEESGQLVPSRKKTYTADDLKTKEELMQMQDDFYDGKTELQEAEEPQAEEVKEEPQAEEAESTEDVALTSESTIENVGGKPIAMKEGKRDVEGTASNLVDKVGEEEASKYVDDVIKEAEKALEKAQKLDGKIKTTDFEKRLAEKKKAEEEVKKAQEELDFWNEVKNELNGKEEPTEEVKVEEETKTEEVSKEDAAEVREESQAEEVVETKEEPQANEEVKTEEPAQETAEAKEETAETKNGNGLVGNDASKRFSSAVRTIIDTVGRHLGKSIEFLTSDEMYKRFGVVAQGVNMTDDGKIYINADIAEKREGNFAKWILGHEVTHSFRKMFDGKVWDTFVETVKKALGADYQKRFDAVKDAYDKAFEEAKKQGKEYKKLTDDDIHEEVCANWAGANTLADSKFAKDLIEGYKSRMGSAKELAKKVLDYVNSIIDRIKAIGNPSARESLEMYEKAKELWQGMYDAYSAKEREGGKENATTEGKTELEAINAINPAKEGAEVTINKDGKFVAESNPEHGEIKLSVSTYDDGGRERFQEFLDEKVEDGTLTKEDADKMRDILEEQYKMCKKAIESSDYPSFNEWSEKPVMTTKDGKVIYSVIKPNAEYGMNLDFSLVCKKRRVLDAVLNSMISRGMVDNMRSANDDTTIAKINDIIRRYGFETACRLCFVDAKRFRIVKVADNFIDLYNGLVKSLVPRGSKTKVDYHDFAEVGRETNENALHTQENADTRKLEKIISDGEKRRANDPSLKMTMTEKIARHLLEHPEDRKLLQRADFLSSRGFDAVNAKNKDIISLYNQKKGSGGPKASESDVQYLNDVANANWDVEKAFKVGGVRIQSFSDFVPHMIFDYMQMFSELAASGLPVHSYTKEKYYVWLFGKTGAKINMSLVPAVVEGGIAPGLDADGNYAWQKGESFDYDDAIAIQEDPEYGKNCGTIAVGISDAHIRKMMKDPNIRMIIPYHKSGINKKVAVHNGIDKFNDYTNTQNTRYKDGKKLDKNDHAKEPSFEEFLEQTGDPNKAAQAYLDWCEEKGYIPKFDQFLEKGADGKLKLTEGYYKLLEDFVTYVPNEKGGFDYYKQEAVKLNYPKEGDKFGSVSDIMKKSLREDSDLAIRMEKEVAPIVDDIERELKLESIKFSVGTDDVDAYNPLNRAEQQSAINEEKSIFRDLTKSWGQEVTKNPSELTSSEWKDLDDKMYEEFGKNNNKQAWRTYRTLRSNIITRQIYALDKELENVGITRGMTLEQKQTEMAKAAEIQHKMQVLRNTREGVYSDEEIQPIEVNETGGMDVDYTDGAEQIKFSLVTDPDEIAEFDNAEKVVAYRKMQLIDGELYPPMAAITDGKLVGGRKEGELEKADERKDLAFFRTRGYKNDKGKWTGSKKVKPNDKNIIKHDGKLYYGEVSEENAIKWDDELNEPAAFFTLKKGSFGADGKKLGDVEARYNSSYHSSNSMCNDQFSSAYNRPNLVTVRVLLSKDDLESGYRGEFSKDAVGTIDWKSGAMSQKLAAAGRVQRKVNLSQYCKIDKIIDAKDVAKFYAKELKGTDIEVPFNTVEPALRDELIKLGVKIGEPEHNNAGDAARPAYKEWLKSNPTDPDGTKFSIDDASDKEYEEAEYSRDDEKAEEMVKDAAKKAMPKTKVVDKDGNPLVVYHQTNSTTFVNKKTGENWDDLDWRSKQEWEERDDWDKYWKEQDFYEFDNKNHGRQSVEMPAFFFSPKYDENHEYGDRTIKAYLNIENPIINPEIPNRGVTNTAGRDAMEEYIRQGYDGFIRMDEDGNIYEYNAFFPEQIKSAEVYEYDNDGNLIPLSERFSKKKDFRFSIDSNDIDAYKFAIVDPSFQEQLNNFDPMARAQEIANALASEKLRQKMEEGVQASEENKTRATDKETAVQGLAHSARGIRSAISKQRKYDQQTVKALTDYINSFVKDKVIDDVTKNEMGRLLSKVKNGAGKEDITKYVDDILDKMIDHHTKYMEGLLKAQDKVKEVKTDATGVVVQGKIGAEAHKQLNTYRDAKQLTDADRSERLNNLMDIIVNSSDADEVERAKREYASVLLAQNYKDNVEALTADIARQKQLIEDAYQDYKNGNMSYNDYLNTRKAILASIRETKLDRIDGMAGVYGSIQSLLERGVLEKKAFEEKQMERVAAIRHFANSDMEGMPAFAHKRKGEDRIESAINSPLMRIILQPLATFDTLMRELGKKAPRGEGYLYNHFMRGFIDSTGEYYRGMEAGWDELQTKAAEIFGKKKMKWNELYKISNGKADISVSFWDGKTKVTRQLTQGNALYIYMVNKMKDGEMKLRKMGIDEDDVNVIARQIDPKLIELADWIQGKFMPKLREKYNKVHLQLFGAEMDSVDNYMPLKINQNSRTEDTDVASANTPTLMPSTKTGAIIKRTKNTTALDILNADALSVVAEHLEQMEHWSAFAQFNKDLSALLSYNLFHNRVLNMRTEMGAGNDLWNQLLNCSQMVAGTYKPLVNEGKHSTQENKWGRLGAGVTASKISFRMFTAYKQLLSMPAFFPEVGLTEFTASYFDPIDSWKWGMANLPMLNQRWSSKFSGETRLADSPDELIKWKQDMLKRATKIGMTPNAFVDALTCAIGAKAVYETAYKRYKKYGFDDEVAHKKAIQDAETTYNESQQSSEKAFINNVQVDKTANSLAISLYRVASMSYTRKAVFAIKDIARMINNRQDAIAFKKKQFIREGLDEEKAEKAAKKEWWRAVKTDVYDIATFGYGLQWLWNSAPKTAKWLAALIPMVVLGTDEDKRKYGEMLANDALSITKQSAVGLIEGLSYGNYASALYNAYVNAEDDKELQQNLRKVERQDLPILSDLDRMIETGARDQYTGMWEFTSLLASGMVGVSPKTFSDAWFAITDACNGDFNTSTEIALAAMRLFQFPNETTDAYYFANVGQKIRKEDGSIDMWALKNFAKRYTEYKEKRQNPVFRFYSDEEMMERMEKFNKKTQQMIKDELGNEVEEVNKKFKELQKTKPTFADNCTSEDLRIEYEIGIEKKALNQIKKQADEIKKDKGANSQAYIDFCKTHQSELQRLHTIGVQDKTINDIVESCNKGIMSEDEMMEKIRNLRKK